MNKRNLKNQMLDEIGRNLLETVRLRGDEIEKIVSAPRLFDDIKTRIRTERASTSLKVSAARPIFSFWSWQTGGAVVAALVLMFIAGLMFLPGQAGNGTVAVETPRNAVPVEKTISVPVNASLPKTGLEIEPEKEPEFKNTTLVYHAGSGNAPVTSRVANKPVRHRQPKQEVEEEEFYPLTFTGNTEEIAFGAHVVRVDLPRSSLSAMGVDLPVGNGADTVKADLLISSDGVAKGFRFVK
jgi:hypothetical protein